MSFKAPTPSERQQAMTELHTIVQKYRHTPALLMEIATHMTGRARQIVEQRQAQAAGMDKE